MTGMNGSSELCRIRSPIKRASAKRSILRRPGDSCQVSLVSGACCEVSEIIRARYGHIVRNKSGQLRHPVFAQRIYFRDERTHLLLFCLVGIESHCRLQPAVPFRLGIAPLLTYMGPYLLQVALADSLCSQPFQDQLDRLLDAGMELRRRKLRLIASWTVMRKRFPSRRFRVS